MAGTLGRKRTSRSRRRIAGATAAAMVCAAATVMSGVAQAAPTTYGYGNARLGADPEQAGISATGARRLRLAWRKSVDGAITGQPLRVDDVRVGNRLRDLVLVGTEHGQIAALDAHDGTRLWTRQVSERTIIPDCDASPDTRFGVTGTLAADPHSGRVYAVDVNGWAWALALDTGRVAKGWPVQVHPPGDAFVWSGLALAHGWLYVPVASLCDSGHYDGGIAEVRVGDPQLVRRWLTTSGTAAYGGGIWGWGGVSIDESTGDVYAATGNSIGTTGEAAGYAESVVRLSAGLVVKQANDPLRAPFAISDRDFGTTPVLIRARGCPAQLVAINKDGELFLYDRDQLATGLRQRIRVAADSPNAIPLYGMPAFDPATRTLVLVSPSTPPPGRLRAGVQAFRLAADCRLHVHWQKRFDQPDAGSPPTIAGGVVYIASGRNGWLRAFRLRDGIQLWATHASRQTIFAAPSVDRGTVLVGDWGGHVSVYGPRP